MTPTQTTRGEVRDESTRGAMFVGNLELLSLRRPLRAGLLIIKKQGWKRGVLDLLEDSERSRQIPSEPERPTRNSQRSTP